MNQSIILHSKKPILLLQQHVFKLRSIHFFKSEPFIVLVVLCLKVVFTTHFPIKLFNKFLYLEKPQIDSFLSILILGCHTAISCSQLATLVSWICCFILPKFRFIWHGHRIAIYKTSPLTSLFFLPVFVSTCKNLCDCIVTQQSRPTSTI